MVTYVFVFKPQEVAEIEISVTQCDSGVTLPQILPRCSDQAPHLNILYLKTTNRLLKEVRKS